MRGLAIFGIFIYVQIDAMLVLRLQINNNKESNGSDFVCIRT